MNSVLFVVFVAALWPFVYYYRFIIPSCSFSLAIGNDFDILYYLYKVYLLDMVASGHFPMWSPSEAAGFPFYSSPFTQSFYPLNLPLFLLYKLLGGYSVFDHQAFTVLGLAIYGTGLCLWLRTLVGNTRAVLFATMVITVSFRLADILRFPNAVHSAAWMPWMLYGITLATMAGRRLKGAVILFVACVMLLTAGYPYYALYCLFLLPPYVLILLWSRGRHALLGENVPAPLDHLRFLAVCTGAAVAALLLCSPYLMRMSSLLAQTVDRGTASYQYATLHEFFLKDTLGSLIFPPAAQTEGWYYFGVLGVLLLAMWAGGILLESREQSLEWLFALLMLVWVSIITYVTYGKHSYLFDLLWNYCPGFSRLRAWGRLNVVMLPILALCLARAYVFLEGVLTLRDEQQRRDLLSFLIGILLLVSTLMVSAQLFLLKYKIYNFYWDLHFKHVFGCENYFVVFAVAATAFLFLMLALARTRPLRTEIGAFFLLACCVGLTAADLRPVGARQWATPALAGHAVRRVLNVPEAMAKSLSTTRVHEEDTTISLGPRFNAGYLENWYFQRYLTFHRRVFADYPFGKVVNDQELSSWKRLMGLVDGRRFFFSRKLPHRTVSEFLWDSDDTQKELSPKLKVISYDGDKLIAKATTSEPLFLSFIDNWDPDWVAKVNDLEVPFLGLFGTFKAVHLPAGTSEVRMEYRPFRQLVP